MNDMALIREYVDRNSELAFADLVHRHIDFVHSVAFRYTGNFPDSQDVTQAVFVILAKKAASLRQRTTLTGWLYETTRFTAFALLRTRGRQQAREQKAYMQSTLNNPGSDEAWRQLAPVLEDAMNRLNGKERALLALRYFNNKSAAETAALLGIREGAAHKRASRALEKLRRFFLKRGINSTTATIAGAISAHSVQAAPVALAKSVTAVALAKGAAASGSTLTLIQRALKLMAWTKAKTAVAVGVAAILATGTTAIVVREITASTGSDAERGPVEMQIKWQAGKKYVMHNENIQAETKQVQKMTENYSLSLVRELDNGGWQLELEFDALTLEVTVGGRKVFSADSTQKPAQDAGNPMGARLRKMVGARIQYFVNANGKVERMEGYPELVTRVAGTNPREQAAFRDSFNETALEKLGTIAEDSTPRRVVKPGDRWAIRLEAPSNAGQLNVDIKCTFKNWEQHADRKCMRIKYTGSFSPLATSDATNLPVRIEQGKFSGDLWFDPELGMVIEDFIDMNMDLKITRQGKSLSMPLNEKRRLALVAVEDLAK